MIPERATDLDGLLAEIERQRQEAADAAVSAETAHLGLVDERYLGLAHNRRHVWLIRELQKRPEFPAGA